MNTDKPFFLSATKMMLSVLMDSPNSLPQMGWETAPSYEKCPRHDDTGIQDV